MLFRPGAERAGKAVGPGLRDIEGYYMEVRYARWRSKRFQEDL